MTSLPSPELTQQAIDTIRMLAVDAVEEANSGHPGMPMGAAAYAFALWYGTLSFDPDDPAWPNRDRFVLSAGHGSMLLYSLLHLFEYDLPLEELKRFRQWESKTPGHPEYGLTPGVETTTGPLGQGFANGVGMALASRMAAERYNTDDYTIIDHAVYGIVSDGDLMEGISAEAASLAGHLGLANLIYFYDDNRISIEGSTELAFTEDRAARFRAYGWQVIEIDGHDPEAALAALRVARSDTERPTLIVARTVIGHGAPTKSDTADAHGAPLGTDEVAATRAALGWPDETFYVPDAVRDLLHGRVEELKVAHAEWEALRQEWAAAEPERAAAFEAALAKDVPEDLFEQLVAALPESSNATRRLSGQVIQRAAELVPYLVGGSADLAPSTSTTIASAASIGPSAFAGRNLHFGVREHAMGAIANGMALYGGWIPYTATFLTFADYMRPPVRLASLMDQQVIFVFTHDSVLIGEDGPTHQPVEHVASLRCIPGLTVLRPSDGAEVAASWAWALQHGDGPTALILTRQGVPTIARQQPLTAQAFAQGAHIVDEVGSGGPDVVIVATGSEVQLGVAALAALKEAGHSARLLSMPSRELFGRLSPLAREALVPANAKKVVIEAGVRFGWGDIVGEGALMLTQDTFGHSAPASVLVEKLGLTPGSVSASVLAFAKEE